jgi:hypothetical protein
MGKGYFILDQESSPMSKVQKAEPGARRKALLLVGLGTLTGALLISGFELCRRSILNWLLSEPEKLSYRAGLLCFFTSVMGSAPLFGVSAYLWSLGGRMIRIQRFPLPGHRVVRETPILEGRAALARGRVFKIMAVLFGVAGGMLCYAFWRLIAIFVKNSG